MEDRIDVPLKDWEKLKARLWQSRVALVIILCFNIGVGCINLSLQDQLNAQKVYLDTKYSFQERDCARLMNEALKCNPHDYYDSMHYHDLINLINAYPPEVQKKSQEILGK